MMKLTKHQIATIKYTNAKGEESVRDIIPTSVPGNIKALDVSSMDADTKELLQTRLEEYSKYTKEIMADMMTFEAWLKATSSKQPIDGMKWRTFIAENVSNP